MNNINQVIHDAVYQWLDDNRTSVLSAVSGHVGQSVEGGLYSDIPVDKLSSRAQKALFRANVGTWDKLFQVGADGLAAIRNCGAGTIFEITQLVHAYGFSEHWKAADVIAELKNGCFRDRLPRETAKGGDVP